MSAAYRADNSADLIEHGAQKPLSILAQAGDGEQLLPSFRSGTHEAGARVSEFGAYLRLGISDGFRAADGGRKLGTLFLVQVASILSRIARLNFNLDITSFIAKVHNSASRGPCCKLQKILSSLP